MPIYKLNNVFQLAGVDLLKLIMAFCVILIHIPPIFYHNSDSIYPNIVKFSIRLAIPFFFVTSGYLLERKLSSLNKEYSSDYLQHRIKKLLKIFGYWLLIYFPITIYNFICSGEGFVNGIYNYLYNLLTRGESLYAWPLWYLYSMAIVYTLILLFSKINGYKFILILIFTAFALLNWLYETRKVESLHYVYLWTDRTLGGGIPILLGMFIYRLKNLLYPKLFILVGITISLILYYFNFPFWEFIGGVSLFVLGISLPLNPGKKYLTMRQQSKWIYSHICIFYLSRQKF